MDQLTQISLFTGCGGIDLAFERAGFESLLQVEIDSHARSVLERHWPDVERIEDVRSVVIRRESTGADPPINSELSANNGRREAGSGIPSGPTVIHFGSPCQDLSIAGKRRGFAGERSGLYTEAIRIIKERRPVFAIWENVPGALSSNHGRDFGLAINLLAEAGALDIAWRVLDAQWFGVPQRRRRIFVVADFRGHRAAEILFEREGEEGYSPPSQEEGQRIAASLRSRSASPGVNMPGRGGEDDSNLVVAGFSPGAGSKAGSTGFQTEQSPTLRSAESGTRVPAVVAIKTSNTKSNGSNIGGDLAFTFDSSVQAVAKPLLGKGNSSHADDLETYIPDVVGTLSDGAHNGGGLNGQDAYSGRVLAPETGVRRLTPTECERLQGFPDGWTKFDADGIEISDSQRFKMLGNSVAVPVLEWIANRMAAVAFYKRA